MGTDLRHITSAPIGIRNNNPGNLRITSINWQGKVPVNQNPNRNAGYEEFYDVEHGIRAMITDIVGDIARKGLNTLTKLITEYAPASDNNKTSAYIDYVSKKIGLQAHTVIPLSELILKPLIRAMIEVEVGVPPSKHITDKMIDDGFNLLSSSTKELIKKIGDAAGETKSKKKEVLLTCPSCSAQLLLQSLP